MDLYNIKGDCVQDTFNNYDKKIKAAVLTHVPKKTVRKSDKLSKIWFNSDLIQHRKLVRNREKVFRKYKQHHQWIAFTKERTLYNKRLYAVKKDAITTQILDSKKDSKKLYRIVNFLTGTNKKENYLPDGDSDIDTANSMANFFLEKVKNIRTNLEEYPLYDPIPNEFSDDTSLSTFHSVSEEDIIKIGQEHAC